MSTPPHRDVTGLCVAAAGGSRQAADDLLPIVYDELRRLARSQLSRERAAQTFQATALVHEAYLRLLGDAAGTELKWDSRGHFFAAAALAMRRILVEKARARGRVKRGGGQARVPLQADVAALEPEGDDLLALDEAMKKLEAHDERKHRVVMLRYFAGLGFEDVAALTGLGLTTVKADWAYARAWLHREMEGGAA